MTAYRIPDPDALRQSARLVKLGGAAVPSFNERA